MFEYCQILRIAVLVGLLAGLSSAAAAQSDVDSVFIKTYEQELLVRTFFSQKYTSVELGGAKNITNLRYRPNTTLNLGIGATYRMVTINLAYGFPFINRDKGEGKTRYLDLQAHIYPRRWTIDFNGQLYKGYYLSPKGLGNNDPSAHYLRPDIKVSVFGLTAYNMINGDRLSYRAALLQNEWQQKSSGTWLIGGEIYGGYFSGDSSLVPSLLSNDYSQRNIRKIAFFELGPGAGYAYTLVVRKHFFIMGSATANLDLGHTREFSAFGSKDWLSIRPNLLYRGVVGYNSRHWNLSLSLIGNRIAVKGASSDEAYYFRTGNFRLTLAKRFLPGPKLHRYLKIFESSQKQNQP